MADCPECGETYTTHFAVQSGDRLRDAFPAPPYTTFKRYKRVCSKVEDARPADAGRESGIDIYLHGRGGQELDGEISDANDR